MKISIDGGGLCTPQGEQFGNYTVTKELVYALGQLDKQNSYYLYTFCPANKDLKNEIYQTNITYQCLRPSQLWLKVRVSAEEIINKKDIFLALNQAIPLLTPARIISLSHGLSFHYFPQFYKNSYHQLQSQLDLILKKSSYVLVSSKKVKEELLHLYPHIQTVKVILFGIPHDFLITERGKSIHDYFLYVGMENGIKNIDFIISNFKRLRKENDYKQFNLYLVGVSQKLEDINEHIFVKSVTSREELRILYAEATALLTASYYESFNLPVLEALSQNCQVIGLRSAIIPEMEQYVNIANDEEMFMDLMAAAIRRKLNKSISLAALREQFSWKKYAEELVEIYNVL